MLDIILIDLIGNWFNQTLQSAENGSAERIPPGGPPVQLPLSYKNLRSVLYCKITLILDIFLRVILGVWNVTKQCALLWIRLF